MSTRGGSASLGGVGSSSTSAGGTQYFSLRWNNHPVNLVSVFTGLYHSETLVDVTLAAEGKHLQAHKMLLSACSDYFQSLFSVNPCQHPIVILKDVSFEDLQTVVQFMYNGIVNVSSEKLPDVLKTADTLQIKGLAEKLDSMGQVLANSFGASGGRAAGSGGGATGSSTPRLLSVPSQHSVGSRQLSTESLPEYLHRTHDLSPRQHSVESRQYSVESGPPNNNKRVAVSPPISPTRQHFRKKFRRMSGGGSSSERGNSMEEDRSPSHLTTRSSPPAIHLSPSRQSSSSTDGGGVPGGQVGGVGNTGATGTIVAKKKRELFSARSSRSGGSNKSSASEYSREHSFSSKHLESSGSSGERQGSISHSVDDSVTAAAAAAAAAVMMTTSVSSTLGSSLTVPVSTRTLGRTQSAGEVMSSHSLLRHHSSESTEASSVGGRSISGGPHPSSGTPTKRSRFLLKRQDCLEAKGGEGELDLSVTPTIVRSSPNSPLMIGGSASPYHSLGSPPPPPPDHLLTAELHHHQGAVLTKQRSAPGMLPGETSLSPRHYSMHDHDQPPLSSSSSQQQQQQQQQQLPPTAHKLPSVRVIPDAAITASLDPLNLDMAPSPHIHHRHHHPQHVRDIGLLHPAFRSRSTESPYERSSLEVPLHLPLPAKRPPSASLPPPHPSSCPSPNPLGVHDMSSSFLTAGGPPPLPPPSINAPSTSPTHSLAIAATTSSISLVTTMTTEQFGHCPKAREGPALGCNYCWNTTDVNGRILRRKTKYHCPDCQANLCIVPCFQAYHEALEKEKAQQQAAASH